MIYQRPPKPDPFELAIYARRRVFVQVGSDYVVIVALKQIMSIVRWHKNELKGVETVWCSAEQLGLFNGLAWDIPALAKWIDHHCVVCWGLLGGKQQRYCSGKCKQKAYRERRR